jgi:hypothetical protein
MITSVLTLLRSISPGAGGNRKIANPSLYTFTAPSQAILWSARWSATTFDQPRYVSYWLLVHVMPAHNASFPYLPLGLYGTTRMVIIERGVSLGIPAIIGLTWDGTTTPSGTSAIVFLPSGEDQRSPSMTSRNAAESSRSTPGSVSTSPNRRIEIHSPRAAGRCASLRRRASSISQLLVCAWRVRVTSCPRGVRLQALGSPLAWSPPALPINPSACKRESSFEI